MDKSPEAFRTISEVAEDMDLPQHVLRFWETRFPQIKPLKRGGGRRYYRPDDVELLRAIKELLYGEGYTIKGVQKLLREQGVPGARPERRARVADGDAAAPSGRRLEPTRRSAGPEDLRAGRAGRCAAGAGPRRATRAGRGFGGVARHPGRFARGGENSRPGARALDRFAIGFPALPARRGLPIRRIVGV